MSSLLSFISGNQCTENAPLDLSIVIDQTESVGKLNFIKMKAFVESLVDKYDVSEDHTHISIMTYAGDPTIHNTLGDSKYHSKDSLKKLIENIPNELSSPTRTDKALEAVRDAVFTAENGDRPDTPNVMIILTDGGTQKGKSTPYEDITPGLDVSKTTTKRRLEKLKKLATDFFVKCQAKAW